MKRIGWVGLVVIGLGALGAFALSQSKPRQGPKYPLIPPAGSAIQTQIAGTAARAVKDYGMDRQVTGRVLYPDGTPVDGHVVLARFLMHQTGMPGEGAAVTGPDGRFEINGLGKDQFMVGASSTDEYIVPSPILVDLRTARTTKIADIILQLGPEVTVHAQNAETGADIPGIQIEPGQMGMPSGRKYVTDAKGKVHFYFNSLQIEAHATEPNTPPKFGPAPGQSLFFSRNLKKIGSVTWDLKLYEDPNQPRPTQFIGTITDQAGNPVAGAEVRLQRYNDFFGAVSDPKGQFSITAPRISLGDDVKRSLALMAEKDGKRAFRVVSIEETWKPMRLVLGTESAGVVRGKIVDQHGKPMPYCRFNYWETYGTAVGSVQPSETKWTAIDGTFELDELHPGAYYSFSFGGFFGQPGRKAGTVRVPGLNRAPLSMTTKPLDLGTIMVPTANRKITVRLMDESGKPLNENVAVLLRGKHTDLSAGKNAPGIYWFDGVVEEPLKLLVFAGKDGFYRTSEGIPDQLASRSVGEKESNIVLRVKWHPAQP